MNRFSLFFKKNLNIGLLTRRNFNIKNETLGVSVEEQISEQKKRNEEVQEMTELIRDFLDPAEFYQAITNIGINFFTGVPDSLLKDFCAYVETNVPKTNHVITANEGNAIALAAGYHLATGKSSLVYLQNSGIGNAVNPLISLAVPNVYSIPMLLLVGWRGEPGKRDEPQHRTQGQVTPGLLAALGIPFQPLPDYQEGAEQALATARQYLDNAKGPYCLLVKRQTFLPYKLKKPQPLYTLSREEALKEVVCALSDRDVVVGTTGMLSRELFELRDKNGQGHEKDFLTVGSMGHASAIALGVAISKPKRHVFCLDGDGSVLMHMGTLATVGQIQPKNFKHIIFNNGGHDSVGGQSTSAGNTQFSFEKIALGNGYKNAQTASTKEEIKEALDKLKQIEGPALLEIKCNLGHRKNLGRPTTKPIDNKSDFMHFLAIN
jgi:phosphonopyruvate decarboxylase